jgi:catechol 2,3-dioxygenase-like lactoylglutathione lyase family enzyme
MDNVAIVVEDLTAAIEFFAELGLELETRAQIEGAFADQTVGLDGIQSEIAMMQTPDGHARLELTRYVRPDARPTDPPSLPPNTLGLHRVMFEVEDIDDTVTRLGRHSAKLLGTIANYEDIYRLCYLRGPSGIIVGLAQRVS